MGKKILIIDDDPAIVDFLTDFFEDHGFETAAAYNGAEGLEKLNSEAPDLITLDMEMPVKGGTMFYAALRRNDATRGIPVILISGVSPRLKKGVPVLGKPVDPEALMQAVSEALGAAA